MLRPLTVKASCRQEREKLWRKKPLGGFRAKFFFNYAWRDKTGNYPVERIIRMLLIQTPKNHDGSISFFIAVNPTIAGLG